MLKGGGQGEPNRGKAVDTSPTYEDVDFDFADANDESTQPPFDNSAQGQTFPTAAPLLAEAGPFDGFAPSELVALGMAEAPPPPEIIEELYVCMSTSGRWH